MRRVIRVLSSLWLTFPTLIFMALLMIGLTFLGGTDFSVGAIKTTVYRSWWFIGLIGVLALNLIACTIKRTPWKWVWQWGFMLTHAGILVIMAGAVVSLLTKVEGFVQVQEETTTDRLLLDGEHEIVFAAGRTEVRVPVAYHPYKVQSPGAAVALDRPGNHLVIEQVIPRAKVTRRILNDHPEENHLIELVFSKSGVELERFVLPEGRKDVSKHFTLATYFDSYERGAAEQERLLEILRKPTLHLSMVLRGGGTRARIPADELMDREGNVGPARVRILEVRRPFGFRRPGTARVELALDGRTYEGVAETTRATQILDEEGRPVADMFLEHQPHPAAVMVFRTGDRFQAVYNQPDGAVLREDLGPGEHKEIALPEGMTARFALDKHYDHARVFSEAEPLPESEKGPAAIRVRAHVDGGVVERWLEEGVPSEWESAERSCVLLFSPRSVPLGFRVRLEDFTIDHYPGSNSPSKFQSTVTVLDEDRGITLSRREVLVNEPISYRGFTFYQSSYSLETERPTSIFQVSRDAGKPLVYLGFILTVLGCVYMFYLKPSIKRAYADRIRKQRMAEGAPV